MKITARLRFLIYFLAGCCLAGYFLLGAIEAFAQTPSGRPPMPGQAPFSGSGTVTTPQQSTTPSAQQSGLPVPESVVEQAKEQNEGVFGPLVRPITPGQIQEVWDYTEPTDGVYETNICSNCTYRIRTRERMVTLIELPVGEIIRGIDGGNQPGWAIEQPESNRIAIKPAGFGYDMSMIVRGMSGQVYPFYIRAEGVNSQNIPDLFVRLLGSVDVDTSLTVPGVHQSSTKSEPKKDKNGISNVPPMKVPGGSKVDDAVDGLVNTNPGTPDGDFVAEAAFNPDKLHGWGQYNLWGADELEPVTVFRDDEFTYIKYGDKWKDLELPTAYVVVDGFDELVNTRVQGQTFIVESTQKLITLKSGFKYMCIEFTGA